MPYNPNTLGSMFPLSLYGAGGNYSAPPARAPRPLLSELISQDSSPPSMQAGAPPAQRPFQTLPQQAADGPMATQPIANLKDLNPLIAAGMPQLGEMGKLPGLDQGTIQGLQAKPKKGLFSEDSDLWKILGVLGDAVVNTDGGQGAFLPAFLAKKKRDEEMQFDREKFSRELEAKRDEAMSPRIEQVGSTLGMLDPSAHSYAPFYSAPQPFESYASAQGYQPGSPEYAQAVKDYRLGSWSDPAVQNREHMAGVNYGYRDNLQDQRLATTQRGQDLAHTDRQRGQTLTDGRIQRGQDLTHADRMRGQDMTASRPQGGSHRAGGAEPTAVGPNGHKIVVRGNRWVDAATGQPVQ